MKWTKPNGTEIETSDGDETIAYCEALGWKRAEERKPRGRPRKEVASDASEQDDG